MIRDLLDRFAPVLGYVTWQRFRAEMHDLSHDLIARNKALTAERDQLLDRVRDLREERDRMLHALVDMTAERDRARSELYAVTFGTQSWKRIAPSPRGERTGWIAPTVRAESR